MVNNTSIFAFKLNNFVKNEFLHFLYVNNQYKLQNKKKTYAEKIKKLIKKKAL